MASTPPTFTPGTPRPPAQPLALDRAKGLSEILRDGWLLWREHTGIFLMTAALIVIPYEVIVTGLLGGGFNDPLGTPAVWAQIASPILLGFVGSALVTAIHSRAVVALAEGRSLTTGEAFSLGLTAFGTVVAAAVVYSLAVIGGFVLLILPGLFIAVAGVFAPQIAALHGTGPVASLKASMAVVNAAGWWRTVGYLIVLSFVATIAVGILGAILGVVSVATGESDGFGAIAVPALAVMQAAAMSWTALVTSLLLFSWRAELGDPFVPGGAAPVGRVTPKVGPQPPEGHTGPTFQK